MYSTKLMKYNVIVNSGITYCAYIIVVLMFYMALQSIMSSLLHIQGFQTSMYASPWFLTMFASVLSLNVVFRIMDIFLLEGKEIIFRVGLGLMEYSKDRLLRGDLEDILKVQFITCRRTLY